MAEGPLANDISEKPAAEKGQHSGDLVEKDEGPGEADDKNKTKDEKETFPGGVKLVLEDYPYAKDGIEIWDAIEKWVRAYCKIFYANDHSVEEDKEIQEWWKEIREVGHEDQKKGWYDVKTLENLVKALTTLIWITSGLHAAVNFGQYAYAGWPLNRPMLLRKFIPKEGTDEFKELFGDPQKFLLQMWPEKFEMAFVIAVMDLLSRHTSDETYLGQRPPENKLDNKGEKVNKECDEFKENLMKIEKNIKERNKMYSLMNRWGYAKIPYKLLYPDTSKEKPSTSSKEEERADITGRGIPNSISI